jgi:tripartite motif-containing protein 71
MQQIGDIAASRNLIARATSSQNGDRTWLDDGEFVAPTGIAVDASGNVYVYDVSYIQKFDSSGNFLTKWESGGWVDGKFLPSSSAAGIAIDAAGNIYVANKDHCCIQKFDSSGKFTTWGFRDSRDGEFLRPFDIAVDAAGNVYVADEIHTCIHPCIHKFDSSGKFLTRWGIRGSGNGMFWKVAGIAADDSGNVYVTDCHSPRIQKFDSAGNFLMKWGSYGTGDGRSWEHLASRLTLLATSM